MNGPSEHKRLAGQAEFEGSLDEPLNAYRAGAIRGRVNDFYAGKKNVCRHINLCKQISKF